MQITLWHFMGILLTLGLLISVGIYSGRHVQNAQDFTTGGNQAGPWLVGGALMGSLVSGQATVGTAQFAFHFGLSAWWFTLGAGIGCLLLGLLYAAPLRRSGKVTLLQVLSQTYGNQVEVVGSILSSLGIFISIIAQVISACALLTIIFPIPIPLAAFIAIGLMAVYVIFGGSWGAELGGILKLLLLYAAAIVGFIFVMKLAHGFTGLHQSLVQSLLNTPLGETLSITQNADISQRFYDLFGRGFLTDAGSGLSLLLGVLSTQTYAQAIWSAKSDHAAKKGALISALLVPPLGIACILIGLYMRGHYITTEEIALLAQAGQAIPAGLIEISNSAQVFPLFVVNHLPKLFGGVVLGTLLITVVGGGAGLSLGVSTILMNDILKKRFQSLQQTDKQLTATRILILLILFTAAIIAILVSGTMINEFGFLSMGLRATVVFIPLTFALFYPNQVSKKAVFVSMLAGPLAVLSGHFIALPFDSLFLGMLLSFLICYGSFWQNRRYFMQ